MKKIFFIALSCFSISCYAQTYPTVALNDSDCSSITSGNLTACFQNKTEGRLNAYQMKMTLINEDGTSEENISNLGALQPDFFSVISTSSLALNKGKVASVWFSVIKGDAGNYQVVPGCSTEITPTSISKSLVTIHKVGSTLYCK